MTHPAPTSVTIRPLPDPKLAEITFFGPTLPEKGSVAIYPRSEVALWVSLWMSGNDKRDGA